MNGFSGSPQVKHAEKSLLSKCCPVCGGRSWTECKLPLAHGSRPAEFNLDDMDALVTKHTIGFLLALIELLPYKQFVCQKCHHEFRMENRNAKSLVRGVLSGMQTVATAKPRVSKPVVNKPNPTAKTVKLPASAPVAKVSVPSARPVGKPEDKRPKAAPDTQQHAGDWEPFHVESDLDSLFDEFDKN